MTIVSAVPFTLQNGTIADATQVMADFNSIKNDVNANAAANGANNDITSLSGLTTPLSPAQGGTGTVIVSIPPVGGRLTLTTAMPVITSDVPTATSVFFTPYIANQYPWFNGSQWVTRQPSEITLDLDSNSGHTGYQQSGKNFDLFLYNDSGTDRLATGPAWTSNTVRGTGAGTTELTRLDGVLVNDNAIVLRYGPSSGDTSSIAANLATYVGTMRATANGQTSMIMDPAAASGGTASVIGLWNNYNRVQMQANVQDNGTAYNYSSATIRQARASAGNQVSIILGMPYDAISAYYTQRIAADAVAGAFGKMGIGLDSTTTFYSSVFTIVEANSAAAAQIGRPTMVNIIPAQLGWHVVSANEGGDGANSNAFGSTTNGAILTVTPFL